MMPTINLSELPHDPTALAAWVVMLALIAYGYRRQRGLDEKYGEIKDAQKTIAEFNHTAHGLLENLKGHVANGHTEPMRAQLDRLESKVDNQSGEIHSIRQELAEERKHRLTSVRELREEIETEVGDVRRRFSRKHGGM